MSSARPTLCLCMIVKNEEAVIERCLDSVRDHIDHWVICDTGSSDDTMAMVRDGLSGIPGQLERVQWVDFGHNRTEALRLAATKADYVLVLDADMVLNVPDGFEWQLTADAYLMRYEGANDYWQVMLVRSRPSWRYEGVTHEYLTAEEDYSRERLIGPTLTHFHDGSNRIDKFERDASLLRVALERDPANERDIFYLAQTLRDLGDYDEAIEWYERRAGAGGWVEERWYALYQSACVRHKRGDPWHDVRDAYLRAYEARPSRLEPLYPLARHYRLEEQYALGRLFAEPVRRTPYPEDALFIERDVYRFYLPLEYAICSHWVGDYEDAIRVNNELLLEPDLPERLVDLVVSNRRFSLDAVYPDAEAPDAIGRVTILIYVGDEPDGLDVCVESALAQDYDDFAVVVADDAVLSASERSALTDEPLVSLCTSPERRGVSRSLQAALSEGCAPNDVVIVLDAHERFEGVGAVATIADTHRRSACWVLYGQHRYADGSRGKARPFAGRDDFARLRETTQPVSPLTFRAGLYQAIDEQDPDWSAPHDAAQATTDVEWQCALAYRLFELAGFERVRFNDQVICLRDARAAHDRYAARGRSDLRRPAAPSSRPLARLESLR